MATHTRSHSRSRKRKPTVTATLASRNVLGAAGVALAAGAAYFFRYELMAMIGYQPVHVAEHVRSQLPIAKDLNTISDFEGNYDIDGVSFDTEGVVISSDQLVQSEPQNYSS